jgi:hypothetical protein
MERPLRPDPRSDRTAQAEERLRAAMVRVSQAQEVVTLAKANQHLALARLALKNATSRDTHDPPRDDTAERIRCEEDDSGAARSPG